MNDETKNRLRWWILLTVIVGTFLGRLDQTIVGLALPKIMDDFGITVTTAGWISTAYILANAVFVPIWGKLGDTIGQKKVYILGFSLFIVGSILAGLSWNLGSMIVFRVIQAIAGSADYPTAMAILALTFPSGKERAQAMGIWSSSFAAATVFGPLLGGPLIDNLGWRWVFYVNLPVGVIGLLMAMAFIPKSEEQKNFTGFDWFGAMALGASLTSLVLVLDKGLDWGWVSSYSALCYVAVVFFAWLFVRIERRQLNPIVDLKFFSNNLFMNVLGNNFIVFMSMMGAIFLVPVFAQTYLGYDATQTGYLFMPMAFMMLLAAPIGANLTGKVKPNHVIMASTAVAGLGIFLLSFLIRAPPRFRSSSRCPSWRSVWDSAWRSAPAPSRPRFRYRKWVPPPRSSRWHEISPEPSVSRSSGPYCRIPPMHTCRTRSATVRSTYIRPGIWPNSFRS